MSDSEFEQLLASAAASGGPEEKASTRLKSKIYSALLMAQAEEGPLRDLDATVKNGRGLCVFEKLVQLSPAGTAVKSFNYCRICHGRVVGEMVENPPLPWACCPYGQFE